MHVNHYPRHKGAERLRKFLEGARSQREAAVPRALPYSPAFLDQAVHHVAYLLNLELAPHNCQAARRPSCQARSVSNAPPCTILSRFWGSSRSPGKFAAEVL